MPLNLRDVIEKKLLPHVSEQTRRQFDRLTLPAVLRYKPSRKVLATIADEVLPQIPERNRDYLVGCALHSLVKLNLSSEKWRMVGREILPQLPEDYRMDFVIRALPRVNDREALHEQLPAVKAILDGLENSQFAYSIIAQNFGKLQHPDVSVSKLSFKKTGSVLVPLGGELTGTLVRKVDMTAYEAWKKASDAGIPVEPIMRAKTTAEGNVRVYTKFVGEVLGTFVALNPNMRTEIERQREDILTRLNQAGISHGHAHELNFVVRIEEGKPVVRIIDFDRAFQTKSG